MTISRPQSRQHQLLLALLLFMVGQVVLALHTHDINLHTVDTDECVVCLVTTSDDPVAVSEVPIFNDTAQNYQPLSALNVLTSQSRHTPLQPRAPPCS